VKGSLPASGSALTVGPLSVTDRDRPTPAASGEHARPVILVVDDAEDMRALLDDVLTSAGYEVHTVASGPSALRFLADRRPDLVITDLLMPGMSGFTLRATMLRRRELASIPVLILSGFWGRPGETLEAADVITKPLSIERLLSRVGALVPGGRLGPSGSSNP
jgi:CheY-like chemotaxis protein